MKAYDKGFAAGKAGSKNDRVRVYQTDKLEKDFWRGYAQGVASINKGKMIVQCERDGKIFAVDKYRNFVICPTCGRTYEKEENGEFHSDRKLTILIN